MLEKIIIYVDGSCHSKTLFGAWAVIIQSGDRKIIIRGTESATTHNRMELLAVIRAIEFSLEHFPGYHLHIYTDSQYVFNFSGRKEKLIENKFITSKGNELPNKDLLETLAGYLETTLISFIKVKAHQKSTNEENLNREVDMICRKTMRDAIRGNNELS